MSNDTMTAADAQAMVEEILAHERGEVVTETELTEDPIQGAFDHEVKPWLRRELEKLLGQLDKKMQGIMRGQFPEQRMEYGITRYAPLSMGPKDFLKSLRTPYMHWRGQIRGMLEGEEPDGDELDESMTAIQAHGKMIARMTDRNDHQGAMLYVAERVLKDKKLTTMAKAIQDIHGALGHMPRELINFRDHILWPRVEAAVNDKFSPGDAVFLLGKF